MSTNGKLIKKYYFKNLKQKKVKRVLNIQVIKFKFLKINQLKIIQNYESNYQWMLMILHYHHKKNQ